MAWKPGRLLWSIVIFSGFCFLVVVAFMFSPARHDPDAIEHATRRLRSLGAGHRVGLPEAAFQGAERKVEITFKREPDKAAPSTPKGPTEQWNGWSSIPKDEDWDFFGLPVPPTAARSRVRPGDVRADYDLNKTFKPTERPAGYEYGSNPAFRYPDAMDRLFWVVSLKPFALYFPRIATDEEVDKIVADATPRLRRSQVAVTTQGAARKESATQEVRTSRSTWVTLDSRFGGLEQRVVNITANKWHEPMNVLLYDKMQHYDSHHDYFDPGMYGRQSTNRMATMFVWLADTEQGGWTTLPRANGGRMPRNYKQASCVQGLQAKPRKGAGLLFYGMRPDRSLDPYSLHGGCDVEKGIKWAGAIWFRANTPGGSGSAHE
eukprot:TRINITY_DN1311_c0_g1_i1.p1 TRINITY_DN1311_c0_g1~~TRINITY_DN1311_c0_g1_i1.p1  ORF type:complete len:404 (+),score=99.18 TRINITY_DN1311_c0_g1_i1:87-1214(+)